MADFVGEFCRYFGRENRCVAAARNAAPKRLKVIAEAREFSSRKRARIRPA